MNFHFVWDPSPYAFWIPIVHWPVYWYSLLFAFGFFLATPIFKGVATRYLSWKRVEHPEIVAEKTSDALIPWMVGATVVGARVAHFAFYEPWSIYWRDPLAIFRVWEGGLASHGAALAIMGALFIFPKMKGRPYPFSPLRLLDFVALPTALVGAFIRMGNFINQEILGKATDAAWGVTFLHPIDKSFPVPRHPVQLYESFAYLAIFFLLFSLSKKAKVVLVQGRLFAIFLILVFSSRFFLEIYKEEQSATFSSFLTMGQLLSIPLIFLGGFLLFRNKWKFG